MSPISERNIDIRFNINVDIGRLTDQAYTFASNVRSFGQVNFSKVLRCRENEVEEVLFKTYIYSYVKSLHNGFFHSSLSESANLGLCYRGHASLFNVLKSPIHNNSENNVFVSTRLNVGRLRDKQILIAYLLKNFNFLRSYRNYVDEAGTSAFYIPEIERCLNFLTEDYFARSGFGDLENIDSRVSDLSDNDKNMENKNRNRKSVPNRNRQNMLNDKSPRGTLHIVEMNDLNCSSILLDQNFPLTNAFNSYYNDQFYYIPVEGNNKIEFNPSVHFSKANFIVLASDYDPTYISDNFYKSVDFGNDKGFLTVHDVHAITGVKGKYFTSSNSKIFNLGDIETLEDLLTRLKDEVLTPESIIDFLSIFVGKEEKESSSGKS
jgi:hypothetical protein